MGKNWDVQRIPLLARVSPALPAVVLVVDWMCPKKPKQVPVPGVRIRVLDWAQEQMEEHLDDHLSPTKVPEASPHWGFGVRTLGMDAVPSSVSGFASKVSGKPPGFCGERTPPRPMGVSESQVSLALCSF